MTRNFQHFVLVRKKQLRNNDFCIAFGAHVRLIREQNNLSMRELAANLDIEYNQLFRIEKGLINTSISMAAAIAEGLGVQPKDLFDFKPVVPSKK